jgi:hypothetical protein
MKAITLDIPRYSQAMDAEHFVHIYSSDKKNIRSVTYVPPKMGARSLRGKFLVRFKTPKAL